MYERWLEVSHEALIRGWPQLREWLSDREGQRLRAQITESAKEWEQHKRDDSVLYRGVRLAQALEWREKEVNRLDLNALELGFLQESESLRRRAQEEKEEQRRRELERERELREQAERLAEEQKQRADDQAKARSRDKARLVVIGGLCIVALLAAAYGFVAAQQAEAAAQTSLALQLAAQSSQKLNKHLAESLLLGVAALSKRETPETKGNLYTALRAKPPSLLGFQWGHSAGVWSVAFSPDGKTLASASGDQSVILWEVASRQAIGEPLKGHSAQVMSVAFSPDGKTLASASADKTVMLWDAGMDVAEWKSQACAIVNRNMTSSEWRTYLGDRKYEKVCPALPGPGEQGWLLK